MNPLSSLLDSINQGASTGSSSAQDVFAQESTTIAPQRTPSAPSELIAPERTMSAPADDGATRRVASEVDGCDTTKMIVCTEN